MKDVNIIVVRGNHPLMGLLNLLAGVSEDLEKFGGSIGLDKAPDLKKDPDFYLKPDVPKALVMTIPSKTTAGKTYQVSEDAKGNLYCACLGFKFRGNCHHVEQVMDYGYGKCFNLSGMGLCINCSNLKRREVLNGTFSCKSETIINCPPQTNCDSFKQYKPYIGKQEDMPMTFPIDGVLVQTFTSRNHPGVMYEVKNLSGDLVCTCRGFNFHGYCKHVGYVRQHLIKPVTI